MQTTKENYTEKPKLVMKVALSDTFRAIKPGMSAKFDCRETGSYSSAKGTITRLNQNMGREEFRITSEDNGATYTVTRQK